MKTIARQVEMDEIRRRVSALAPGDVARWGRMTVGQVVCHLSDGCRMAMGEGIPNAPRPIGRVRTWIALWGPIRWPRGIQTTPELDQLNGGGTPPAVFEKDVSELLALLARLPSAPGLDGRVHPVFGPMSKRAWLRWAYLHFDHHLRQFGA